MRKLLIALLLSATAFGQSVSLGGTVSLAGTVSSGVDTPVTPPSGCGSGYAAMYKVLLQRAVGSDLSLYPYAIRGSEQSPALQTAMMASGSGGNVLHTTTNSLSRTIPADVVWCPDNTGTGAALKYEIDSYDGTTAGAWTAAVQKPTLFASSDNYVYVAIGKSSVTTSQEDLSLWSDAGIIGRWAFPDGSTLDLKDSAGSFNGTNHSATATPGSFGGALNLGGSQNVTASLVSNATHDFGMEILLKYNGVAQAGILMENGSGSNGYNMAIINNGCGTAQKANIVLNSVGCGGGGADGYFMIPGTHHLFGLRQTTQWYLYGDGFKITGANNNPTTPTSRTTFGSNGADTAFATTIIDEARQYNYAPSDNWIATNANTMVDCNTGSLTDDTPSYSQPTVRQKACANALGTLVFNSPFPLTSGGVAVLAVASIGNNGSDNCASGLTFTSGLGLTYTLLDQSHYTGTLRYYHDCVFTAPITTAGRETLTFTSSNVSIRFFEVKHATVTGATSANANGFTQPHSISATSPGANSWLLCTVVGDMTNVPASTTPSYTLELGAMVPLAITDHPANMNVATSIVGTGSKSCQFNPDTNYGTAGPGGVLIMLASAP